MMTPKRFHTIIATLTFLVVGLGVANWYFKPESARSWAIGIAAMPAIWGFVAFLGRRRSIRAYGEAERRFFTGSVIVAGLILAATLGIKLIDTLGDFDSDNLERVWGVVIGAVLVVMGNVLPKILRPLAAQRCSESKTQSIQRFAGWSFVLAGLAYAIVWMVLPVA
ncbi:MAG: hypothetical protein O7H40_12605 [Gammaproteobacteria bacterium]|nr:hypothetical protein [Gammaproteobacteria bacterium]